jgi:hypothetical protein
MEIVTTETYVVATARVSPGAELWTTSRCAAPAHPPDSRLRPFYPLTSAARREEEASLCRLTDP